MRGADVGRVYDPVGTRVEGWSWRHRSSLGRVKFEELMIIQVECAVGSQKYWDGIWGGTEQGRSSGQTSENE